jgi:hypothetical protein
MSSSNNQTDARSASARRAHPRLAWLLTLPFIAMLLPPLFNYQKPSLGGMPFFYWYQLFWIPLTSIITWVVYRWGTSDPQSED